MLRTSPSPVGQTLVKVGLEYQGFYQRAPLLFLHFDTHAEIFRFVGAKDPAPIYRIAEDLCRDVGQKVAIFDRSDSGQSITIAFANGSIQKFGDLGEMSPLVE